MKYVISVVVIMITYNSNKKLSDILEFIYIQKIYPNNVADDVFNCSYEKFKKNNKLDFEKNM